MSHLFSICYKANKKEHCGDGTSGAGSFPLFLDFFATHKLYLLKYFEKSKFHEYLLPPQLKIQATSMTTATDAVHFYDKQSSFV